MSLAKSNRVAAACTGCPTKSELQSELEWTPRAVAILYLKRKWTSFIACTIVYEGSFYPAGAANARVIIAPRLRYFIFYTIAADEIRITHIRHTSRRRPRNSNR